MADVDVIPVGWKSNIPYSMIAVEMEGLYGSKLLAEFADIIQYYKTYEEGAYFTPINASNDFIPSDIRLQTAANLIDKEARFMFAVKPDVTVQIDMNGIDKEDQEAVQNATDIQTKYQTLIDKVLDKTKFADKILKAAKDCFIGKRVAYAVNFDEESGIINLTFVPSLGFVYDTDPDNTDILSKLIIFYAVNDSTDKGEQRIYKKKYELINNKCHITEGVYNGHGDIIEEDEFDTPFSYIPGGVILNDGLTGDMSGVSDIAKLLGFESNLNRMQSADLDAERQNMNPITYTIDMDGNSTKGLSRAPGSYWDMATDDGKDGKQGQIGTIEPKMEYSDALGNTVSRIRAAAYEKVDIPDVSSEALKGVVSSGKTLKAIYWSLMVRCDEKFIVWRSQIQHMAQTIIDGCKFYPECAKQYIDETLPDADIEIIVENNYPIQDDQTEEKEMDLQEVHYGVRSKKSYMKKYLGLSDKEVEEELQQMARERQIQEESSFMPRTITNTQNSATNQQTAKRAPTFQDFLNMEQNQNSR